MTALTLRGIMMPNKKKQYEGLAERIILSRKKMRLNQCQLADICSLTHECINRAEKGKATPHDYTLKQIAEATKTTIEFLKYGKE